MVVNRQPLHLWFSNWVPWDILEIKKERERERAERWESGRRTEGKKELQATLPFPAPAQGLPVIWKSIFLCPLIKHEKHSTEGFFGHASLRESETVASSLSCDSVYNSEP